MNAAPSLLPSLDKRRVPDARWVTPDLVKQLCRIPDLDIHLDVDLSRTSRWKIGGVADGIVCPHSTEALQAVMKLTYERELPVSVIGLTSNLLFAQDGIRALVIHVGNPMSRCVINGNRVHSQAGIWVPGFARRVARAGLSGVEHMAGIPGTLGGLLCMNGGSQQKGVGDHLVSVTTVDQAGNRHIFNRAQCHFAYRRSLFQSNQQIITDAEFEYAPAADPRNTRQQMKRILEERRRKFPQKQPNCGSVFVSNPALYKCLGPPGAVIEQCGLKGLVRGDAEISSRHANFIVNRGSATTADVLYLIEHIRRTVQQQTGFELLAEVKYVDTLGRMRPAHEAAQQWAAGTLFHDHYDHEQFCKGA